MVVDDNHSHLMKASELLEQCGSSSLLASDGAEAVHLACERSFDIILMDLLMPVLDGLQATSRIRQFEGVHSRRRTPVAAYSTSNVSTTILTGTSARVNATLLQIAVYSRSGARPMRPIYAGLLRSAHGAETPRSPHANSGRRCFHQPARRHET